MSSDGPEDNEMNRLRKENLLLRSFIASKKGCDHCLYGFRLENGACQLGYPGCGCLDDIVLYESQMTDALVGSLIQAYSVAKKNGTMPEVWFERALAALEPHVPLEHILDESKDTE